MINKLTIAIASILSATNAAASEWKVMPFLDDGWKPNFAIAATLGVMDFTESTIKDRAVAGLQLNLHCPWFEPPKGIIRQQMNYTEYDKSSHKIKMFEINPRYYFSDDDLRFGVGPGFGYLWSDKNGVSDDMWTFQMGGDVEYHMGMIYVGAGARYMIPSDSNYNNLVGQIKVGVNF